jgi:hypothetical protein
MHVRFAHAATSKTRVGGARMGVVAYAVGPADGARVVRKSRVGRFIPSFAPFNTEKQIQALPAFGIGTHAALRCGAVAAKSIRETLARKGVVLCEEAFFSITWAAAQAVLEIKAKILAGDVARIGILADWAEKADWLRVLRRALWASRERHEEAGFALDGEERWRAPVALYDVEDGARGSRRHEVLAC